MFSYSKLAAIVVAIVFFLAQPLHPGTADSPAALGFTFYKAVQEVRIAFQAQSPRGAKLSPLTQDDIVVFEDGNPISSITTFQHYDDTLLDIAILVDESDSMRANFAAELDAVQKNRNSLARPEIARLQVIRFATGIHRLPPQKADFSQGRAEGQTALYDTLYDTMQDVFKNAPQLRTRRIVLLFSDGEDNWSRHNLDDVIRTSLQHDVSVFAVTAHSRGLEFPGDRVLRKMADATGGHYFLLGRYAQADRVFPWILSEAKSQYVVTFRPQPSATAGEYHSLKIAPRSRKWKIRARRGYYAGPLSEFR